MFWFVHQLGGQASFLAQDYVATFPFLDSVGCRVPYPAAGWINFGATLNCNLACLV